MFEIFIIELKKILQLKKPELTDVQVEILSSTLVFAEIEKCLLENLQYASQRKRFQKKITDALESQNESQYLETIYRLLYLVPNSIMILTSRLHFFVSNLKNNQFKFV